VGETYTSGVWVVKAGETDAFVAAWEEFARWAKSMQGCGTLRLTRDAEDESRFLSFAPWESFEAQRAWKENPEFRDRLMRVREHVVDFTPSTYELLAQVD
jgi:heme-degrading monooxygenase HmoA